MDDLISRKALRMHNIQSAIGHIKSAVDVDPWAAEAAEAALKKALPMKWVMGKPYRVNCPECGATMDLEEQNA